MKVYKQGIVREIDKTRKQEFLDKGYTIEGVASHTSMEALKQENAALKQQLMEALKRQTGGETGGETEQTKESTEQTGDTKATTRGKK